MRGPTMSRMSSGRPPVTGFLIVVLAASLFGMLGPLSRYAYDAGMEPLPFVAWRAGIGFLAAAAFIGWRVANGREPLTRLGQLGRGERVTLAIAALLGFALNFAMFISFDLITIALALLGFYTYPVIVAVVNVGLGREALDRTRVAALGLAVIGMIAVVAGQLDPASTIKINELGIALALVAAGCQAAFVVISRDGYPSVPSSQAMAVVLGTTVVCSVVIAAVTGSATALTFPLDDPSVLPLLAFTGLFAAAIPSILFLTGIRRIGGTRAGILMLFEPVVGVALAAILLGESIAPVQVLGGLAILAAAVILQLGTAPTGRTVAAPAIEADQPDGSGGREAAHAEGQDGHDETLPAGPAVSVEGGST
jgi:DME family drug/metabolite transporter